MPTPKYLHKYMFFLVFYQWKNFEAAEPETLFFKVPRYSTKKKGILRKFESAVIHWKWISYLHSNWLGSLCLNSGSVTFTLTIALKSFLSQCCGSGMFISDSDPNFSPFRIPDNGYRSQEQQNRGGRTCFSCLAFFCHHKFYRIKNFWTGAEKN